MSTLSLGVITHLTPEPEALFAHIRDLGVTTCQLVSWQPEAVTRVQAERTRAAAEAAGVTITLFWCGYSGPRVWNFVEGPSTIGLVPAAYREVRTRELLRGVAIADWLGVPDLATHVGFLPIDPATPDYRGAVDAVKRIAEACAARALHFDFETGQETPVVLLRCLQDVGLPNVGVNLDPANLLMYGNGNPLDALQVIGRYVRGVHAKDGDYPTDGYRLGAEKPLGEGQVNFPALVRGLKALGYRGALTIEREITGAEQEADIRRAVALLTPML